ncbi:MAG: arginine repressor [Clostridia bacterium]|nr:arginine repressor [Clostridia bacterium]
MSKKLRHKEILKIIAENVVETQGQLTDFLLKEGFDVTQATVSRDIKELRLIKIADYDDRYRYAEPSKESDSDLRARYITVLKHSLINMQSAGNIMVMKTIPGSAQVCAMAIETLGFDEIAGVIAGDDTVFVAIYSDYTADGLIDKINEVIK